ncbi:MAG: NAD(P)H-dependent oxidoreductase subunit E [Oscillospiraceae bacterium]|nr:NAD(P)H-dependent oxidoreductase subunit E [Oscillospiraceae bacterium]
MRIIAGEEINALLNTYPRNAMYTLAVMQDMQRQFGYVPREGLDALSGHLERPLSELYAIATFYKALSLTPRGKHIIKVCDGTVCHIRAGTNVLDGIYRALGIGPGEMTDDGEFSLELVNCLGACALAPVMVVDGTYYGKIAPESLHEVFDAIRAEGVID